MKNYATPRSRRETARQARRKQEHRSYLELEKIRRGCEITGVKLPPDELEWHHLDASTKRYKVAAILQLGHTGFFAELSKCICVSRGAHRALHAAKQ